MTQPIDPFGRKRLPNEALLNGRQSLLYFASKYVVKQELQAVKYSLIKYVWSMVVVFFCYSV